MTDGVIGLFIYLTGLCVGSFLNVVIYRLPRGLSISKPAWSFCPLCKTTLRWYDNLPVLGWLLLRARCRHCHEPISAQYPLIEAITGLAFVLTYHLLFIADARAGADQLTWPTDVPLLLAWLILVAALIVCSVMDLLWYVVDTRITDIALVAGIVLSVLWPRPDFFAGRAASPAAAAAAVAFVVSGVMLWRTAWRDSSTAEEELLRGAAAEDGKTALPSPSVNVVTVLAIMVFVGLAVWLLAGAATAASDTSGALGLAVPAAFLALFAAMVLSGGQPRAVDDELHATIEAEAPAARRLIQRELVWLSPAIVAAIITYFVVRNVSAVNDLWQTATSWTPVGRLAPLGGAVFAVHGAIVAAAAGWIIRIFFTLVFGREAFGVGDIYILAAAGAVGGWDIALLGFLLSVFIALLGWIIGLLLKRPGMIPFGPPLAIGFLAALWLNQRAAALAASHSRDLALAWQKRPDMVLLGVGLLLVVLPISIVLAKLTRRLVERQEERAEVSGGETKEE
ncbi:MAG: prepilin peptidase [Phycisphaerae bacterium]